MPLATGARLGPYEIVGPIGKGGMGEVYRARDTRLGREVAIKVLPTETEQSREHLARFQDEARAVAALNHPNILALHDIGTEAGIAYAVMELLQGETLRDRLESGGRLPPAKAIDFAIQILNGLAAAHARGIIHRDLKPENLFVTQDGRVKILDFGLAQHREPLHAESGAGTTRLLTTPGVVMGTPGYLSPEQIVGEAATTRSDLFAFGVVVAEMLTGAHPFRRATAADTVTAVLREDPPALGSAAPTLPSGVAAILSRCLEKHAGDRPESARDLALYLRTLADRAEPDAAPVIAATELRQVRLRALIVSCGLLLLFTVVTWMYVRVMADRAVTAAIDDDLARAEQLVLGVQRDRLAALSMTARLVASIPELKALFGTDAATVRDYLVSYQQRNPQTPLLIALGPDGGVLARTDDAPAAGTRADWLRTLIERQNSPSVVRIGDSLYHAAPASADAGGSVFGYIVCAAPIDARFAGALRDATQDEVLLLSDTAVLASTLRAVQTPWRTRDDWRRAGGQTDAPSDVSIATQQFRARDIVLVADPKLSAVVLESRDEAIAPFHRIQTGVVLIGLLCAAGAAFGIGRTARLVAARQRR